jgi:hypothetical protein
LFLWDRVFFLNITGVFMQSISLIYSVSKISTLFVENFDACGEQRMEIVRTFVENFKEF